MKYTFKLYEDGSVKSAVWYCDEEHRTARHELIDFYYTNNSGEGVFAETMSGNVAQLTGTGQFSVCGLTKPGARAKIRRFMEG